MNEQLLRVIGVCPTFQETLLCFPAHAALGAF